MIGVFVKDTQGEEEAIGRQRQELEGCSYKPRNASNPRSWESRGSILPKSLRECSPSDTFWTFGHQNCERIHFCFKPSSLHLLLWHPWEMNREKVQAREEHGLGPEHT